MLKKTLIVIGIILIIGFISAFVRGCTYHNESNDNNKETTPTITDTEKQNIIDEDNITNIIDDDSKEEKKN